MQPSTASPARARMVQKLALEPESPGEDVRLWRNGDLPGLELLVALKCNRRWRVIHDTYTVCVVPRANNLDAVMSTWRYRGREYVYRRKTLGLMEPGETHAVTRLGTGGDFWVAMLDPGVIARAARELSLSNPPHFRLAHTSDPALLVLFSRLYQAIARGVSPLEQEIRLAACLRLLLETCADRTSARTGPEEHPRLRRAREYLDAYYAGPVGLDELAAAAGLGRFYLARAFNRAYGLPPHQYQVQLRLTAVRRDLRRGVPLADIDAGFYDQSHLNRHFKHGWGLTPRQYASPPASPLPQFG